MKNVMHLTTAAIFAMLVASAAVQAEQPQPQQGQQQAAEDPEMAAARKAEQELEFKNRKEEILLRIDNQLKMIQKRKDCVQAASTREALHECKAEMGGGPGGPGGPGGQGRSEGRPGGQGGPGGQGAPAQNGNGGFNPSQGHQ